MTEKVKLTQEQDTRLKEMMMDVMYSKDSILVQQSKGWRNESNICLNTLSLGQLARVLFEPNSYEIEPKYEIGEWIKHDVGDGFRIGEIVELTRSRLLVEFMEYEALYKIYQEGFDFDEIVHASSEEFKDEKECRLWAKAGREVGDLKEKDLVIYESEGFRLFNHMGCEIYRNHMDPVYASKLYEQGEITGFYPAESFISFESEESE